MAYFNHAFQKVFWGGSPDTTAPSATGYINNAGVSSVDLLNTYGVGAFTFADQSAAGWPSVAVAPANGAPLTLLATSLYQNDKVGPFHGGYQETTKSKMVNPKYITDFYYVEPQAPVNNIIGVGATPNIDLGTNPECCPQFFCNETYGVRFDIKGSPTLRMLNHNAYEVACAYTGCCDGPTPEEVDPALVMQTWMNYIVNDPIFSGVSYAPGFPQQADNRLVNVGFTVTCDGGTNWDFFLPDNPQAGVAGVYFQADGTTPTQEATDFYNRLVAATGATISAPQPSNAFSSTFTPATPNCCAGLVMEAAFVETQFGDCTFQVSDHFEIEPLQIQASMVDDTGDPCVFEQLCISDGITPSGPGSQAVLPAIQLASQAMGTGEQVLRDLILSESYGQNHFGSNDLRIREITQGYDITSAVDRTGRYGSYYIKHSVPRYNNPSGTFDNDQYLLRIPVDARDIVNFEAFMLAWMTAAGNPLGAGPVPVY
jgi:hypothetical protein